MTGVLIVFTNTPAYSSYKTHHKESCK